MRVWWTHTNNNMSNFIDFVKSCGFSLSTGGPTAPHGGLFGLCLQEKPGYGALGPPQTGHFKKIEDC